MTDYEKIRQKVETIKEKLPTAKNETERQNMRRQIRQLEFELKQRR